MTFGCEAGNRFPAVKLLDLATQEAMLEASRNPFAQVALAYLKAREIQEIHEEEKLEAILQALRAGSSLDEVRRLWSPDAS